MHLVRAHSELRQLDALLRAVQADYAIDPERIYVLGHSMGSRPAALLAADDPRIAAGCVFAGGVSGDAGADHPPFRIYAGALDPLSPPSRAERAVRRARDAGAPVELLRLEAYGHTLGVGARLPEAVDWLLTQRR